MSILERPDDGLLDGPAGVRTIVVVSVSDDRWLGLLCVGLVCWTFGFVYEWCRFSLWIFDLVLIPAAALLYLGGYAAMAFALLKREGGGVEVAVVIGGLAFVMLMVNPGHRIAPQTWFLLHRPLFEVARHVDPGTEYYGNPLPLPLRYLSVGGDVSRVSVGERRDPGSNIRFFPQWIGIPDDAGGYLYSPDRSPAGADLYGSLCVDPVDLGGGWWMCNL